MRVRGVCVIPLHHRRLHLICLLAKRRKYCKLVPWCR